MTRSRRKSHQRARPSSGAGVRVVPVSLIPLDLCNPSQIRGSFGTIARSSVNFGLPLLPIVEPDTTPASLAVESLVHLTEGWRFLSAALAASLNNSSSQAIHFAYYAELRAAISLLSSHGMRVNNRRNTYLNSAGNSTIPPWANRGTHDVVWALWKDWSATATAECLLMDQLYVLPSVRIRDLKACVSKISAPPTLAQWALDLSMGNEHYARNEASYLASAARGPISMMLPADFELVRDLWALAEPSGFGLRFEQELARYLVSQAMMDADPNPAVQATWLAGLIADVARDTGCSPASLDALFRDATPISPVFNHAFDAATKPINMLARAFFLLRLATLMQKDAHVAHPATVAKEWLKDWLEHAGLFDRTTGVLPEDKWLDFEHLIRMPTPTLPLPATLHSNARQSVDAHLLTRTDAVLAWSTNL